MGAKIQKLFGLEFYLARNFFGARLNDEYQFLVSIFIYGELHFLLACHLQMVNGLATIAYHVYLVYW
jgi:hypothetical protein